MIVLDFIEYLVYSFISYISAYLHIYVNVFGQIGRIYVLYNMLSAGVTVDVLIYCGFSGLTILFH